MNPSPERPTPEQIAHRIRQAGLYAKSRKALERHIEADPEFWIPALLGVVDRDLGESGEVVGKLLANFADAHTDFQTRFWLYQEIPGKSAHFHRLKIGLASWVLEQMHPSDPVNRPLRAQMELNLSQHLRDGGRVEEAISHSKAAVSLYEDLAESDASVTGDLVWAWMLHAQQVSEAHREMEGVEANLAAVKAAERLQGEDRNRLLGQAFTALGIALIAVRQRKEALAPLLAGYSLLKKCEGPEKEYVAVAAPAATFLADALLELGLASDAEPYADEARRNFEVIAAKEPGVYMKDYLWATNVASRVAIALGQTEKSRSLRYEGVQMLQGLADRYPKAFLEALLLHLTGLISALIRETQWTEAENYVRQAIRFGRKWGRISPSGSAIFLGSSYAQLASVCLGQKRWDEGLRSALRARSYLRRLPEKDQNRESLLPTVEEQLEAFRLHRKR